MTLVVQIGNTDNRLSQAEWSEFVSEVRNVMREKSQQVYFDGGANWDAPKQNACWVSEIGNGEMSTLLETLTELRKKYHQESVAIITGNTIFI